MVFNGTKNNDSMDYEWDVLSGVIKHGWLESPQTEWRFIARTITDIHRPFFIAMVDYRRVVAETQEVVHSVGHWVMVVGFPKKIHGSPVAPSNDPSICNWKGTWLSPNCRATVF